MNIKFELTTETRNRLFRIRAKVAFGTVAAGELGGFVASETNLSVHGDAWVYGNAQVYGDARVYGGAQVSGDAWVFPPPYIQGSRHALTLGSLSQIAVGGHIHDIKDWLKTYRAIGKREGYTKEQIAEYGLHLAYLAAIAKRLQAAAKKAAKTKK